MPNNWEILKHPPTGVLSRGEVWRHGEGAGEHFVSASQINTWLDCPRKWGFRYLDGIEEPPSAGAEFGKRVHSVLEGIFNAVAKGDSPSLPGDLDQRTRSVVLRMLEHYPDFWHIGGVEHTWWLANDDGQRLRGVIDLYGIEAATHRPILVDHKTSSDIEKYALSEDGLRRDVQGMMYALWYMQYHQENEVSLRWVYGDTRRARSTYVETTVDRSHVAEVLETKIEPAVDQIYEIGCANRRAEDLPYNLEACSKYGGCPYAKFCSVTQEDGLRRAFILDKNSNCNVSKENNMSILQTLRSKKLPPPRPGEQPLTPSVHPPETRGVPNEVKVEASKKLSEMPKLDRQMKKEKEVELAESMVDAAQPSEVNVDMSVELPVAGAKPDQLAQALVASGWLVVSKDSRKASKTYPYVHGRTIGAVKRGDRLPQGRVLHVDEGKTWRRLVLLEAGQTPPATPDPAIPIEQVPAPYAEPAPTAFPPPAQEVAPPQAPPPAPPPAQEVAPPQAPPPAQEVVAPQVPPPPAQEVAAPQVPPPPAQEVAPPPPLAEAFFRFDKNMQPFERADALFTVGKLVEKLLNALQLADKLGAPAEYKRKIYSALLEIVQNYPDPDVR